jgi:dienelactone hydrolase
MLGWPLVDHLYDGLPAVKSVKLSDEDGFSIYRMHFEILDGVEMSGLYFEMHTEEKKPLVLVQHGGLGTPELIAGVYGYTANYNQMLERVIAQGVHAFAPQLLLWDKEYEVPFEREKIDARLKRVGSSITAVELYGMMRILDYFEVKDNISTIGMVGLSYGGFYTLFLSALDTRIKSAISCAFFNTRDKQPWSDWVWFESAGKFDDAEIACMVYPRKLCIEIADNDTLFDVSYGKQAFERIKEMAGDIGTDWLDFIVFEGKHEFCKDDAPIENMVKNL